MHTKKLMIAALLWCASGCAGASQPGHAAAPREQADQTERAKLPMFPDLEAPLLGGGTVRIASMRGHVVVLDVMASWCQTCTELLPLWDQLAERHHARPLQVLLVSQDEDPEEMRELAKRRKIAHRIALDGEEVWWKRLGLVAVPTAIVIGADGRHVATLRHLGEGGFEKLEAVVESELARAEREGSARR
jgi:cytochrome c biogenesis protein CcmG/thiol:disulfide interchange protein DsbE